MAEIIDPDVSLNTSKPLRPKKTKIILLIAGTFILVLAATTFYNRDYLRLYYLNARYNKLQPGNKLYALPRLVKDTLDVEFFSLIRPITEKDIDAQQLTELEKDIAKKALIKSTKTYLCRNSWYISADKLYKLRSAYIGTYQGSDILDDFIGGKKFTGLYFIIKPNEKALAKQDIEYFKMPKGYTWADGPFYVSVYNISEQELPEFKK